MVDLETWSTSKHSLSKMTKVDKIVDLERWSTLKCSLFSKANWRTFFHNIKL